MQRIPGRQLLVPAALLPLVLFAYFCTYLSEIISGKTFSFAYSWVPELNINLAFYLDGLSLFFALLISGFGVFIMVYSAEYLRGHPLLNRFYLYLSVFMLSMLGLVLADNLICLFIFWELTSISSYLLIGFSHDNPVSRSSALQALLVTGLGGLALMTGMILLGNVGGTYTISELLTRGELVKSHPLYLPALLLILLGAFTKSAQFPFHFWLPNAMAAPTPVSAYLHSATMVKAGVYLLARFTPVLGGTEVWQYTLVTIGAITALLGALLAVQHIDLKAILANTTISSLGVLMIMLGIGTPAALEALLVFILAHALNKCALFLITGNIDHATGTRDFKVLYGLALNMRPTAVAATMAALSFAGMVPFLGFISKEMLYDATLGAGKAGFLIFSIVFISKVVAILIAIIIGYKLFWPRVSEPTPIHHPCGLNLTIPPMVMASAALAFGMLPGIMATPLIQSALAPIAGKTLFIELKIWHGLSLGLINSIMTFILGTLVYTVHSRIIEFSPRLTPLYNYGPNSIYQFFVTGLVKGSSKLISIIQSGYVRSYISAIVLTMVGLVALSLWNKVPLLNLTQEIKMLHDVRLYELVLLFLILPGLFFLFKTHSRLIAIAIMGIIGYSVALFYILFGAPDVAATQLLIETLTVVLFVLVLHRLPPFRFISHKSKRYKYILISALFGAMMTYVVLLVKQYPLHSELKQFYGDNSYLQGHGRNIVNVILVDFRGFDTLGEITVLAVAAIGIVALLRLRLEKGGKR
ncbi:hydrogen gas-evolving membrane-bound hydrogenase subunit E [Pontibacter vulgaris]|uniref:hydrogen gas-evolving membrane-bound hydrogenase subunit E n=1 Tax=Pontibacter vulgaris TaxID=2905679 RepID=UPI001FA811BA|nr:hydrogen gas-evolving membrane-bound hydrogenase subunit E [Pontibacter vulgaris]